MAHQSYRAQKPGEDDSRKRTGVIYLQHTPFILKAFGHMSHATYFLNILRVAQLSGALALFVPGQAKIKEWAYAGFAITYVSGCISHLVSGDGLEALQPLIVFGLLVTSYVGRPAGRKPDGL